MKEKPDFTPRPKTQEEGCGCCGGIALAAVGIAIVAGFTTKEIIGRVRSSKTHQRHNIPLPKWGVVDKSK